MRPICTLLLCSACAVNATKHASKLFVAGTLYCASDVPVRRVAAGKRVRLVSDEKVLAEDVTGADGSFVLHPREQKVVDGTVFIETEGERTSLANDYASWMQDDLSTRAKLTVKCESPDAGEHVEADAEGPARPPPSPKLLPH